MGNKIMPKEIELDDGTKETVYTEDEVKGYKQGAEKNKERKETLSSFQKELDIKEGETIESKLQELKETANPNFGKYRKKFNAMESELKKTGKVIDDDGTVVDGNKPLTADDINKTVEESVKNALSTTARDKVLGQYKEEDRKVVEHYLDKLMVTGGTLEENLAIAEAKAFPGQNISDVKIANNNLGGQAPHNKDGESKRFTDTDEGKKLLEGLTPPGAKKENK